MKIFVTDLDNTIIYSYKRNIGPEKVLIETKDNTELSFMSKYSHDLLKSINFIPLTTRSLKQYERIKFFENFSLEYALVANGGILLCNGVVEESWYKESINNASLANDEFNKAIELLSNDNNIYYDVTKIDNLFLFAKSSQSETTVARLISKLDLDKVNIYNQGDKVYIFPKKINKGEALERLRKKLKAEFVVCAGDSVLDLPMLAKADIAIYPEEFPCILSSDCKKYVISKEEVFSDKVLEIAKKYL